MPTVVFTCECKCAFQRWMKSEPFEHACPLCGEIATDVIGWEGARVLKPSHLRLPNDQYDYISPIDGAHIASKRAHRDHLKRHGVIELGNEKPKLKPFEASVPRDSIKAEMRNQLERMKSDGSWRER